MPADLQQTPTHPRLVRLREWWDHFSSQWQHGYVLLTAMFWVLWRLSPMPIPNLESDRVLGGLHPGDALLMRDVLRLTWLPVVLSAVAYALSFRIRILNTPQAIAVSALCSCGILLVILITALIRLSSY